MSSTGMPEVAMIWLKWVTMMLRIWNSISSVVNSPSVPTISVRNFARVGDPHGVGAEGAQPHHAELRVAAGDRVPRPPLQVGEAAGVDEVDLGLERALEAVVPVLQRGQDRQVVGLELVEPGAEDVGELALVDEDRRLPLADGELGAVLDRVALALEAPDDGVAGVVGPVDDVDELAAQEIEDRHRVLPPVSWRLGDGHAARRASCAACASRAMAGRSGRASSAVMPGRRRGS